MEGRARGRGGHGGGGGREEKEAPRERGEEKGEWGGEEEEGGLAGPGMRTRARWTRCRALLGRALSREKSLEEDPWGRAAQERRRWELGSPLALRGCGLQVLGRGGGVPC